jgi:hypothetical protein
LALVAAASIALTAKYCSACGSQYGGVLRIEGSRPRDECVLASPGVRDSGSRTPVQCAPTLVVYFGYVSFPFWVACSV